MANQSLIIEQLASRLAVAPEAAETYLGQFSRAINKAVSEGSSIELREIGTIAPGSPKANTDLLPEMMEASGESSETVRNIIESVQVALRQGITTGQDVVIDGVGSFASKRNKARITKDPRRGHRLIEPASVSVQFNAGDDLLLNAGGEVGFTPSDALTHALEAVKTSTILLVFPDDDFFVQTLSYYFQQAGWKTELVTTADDAKEKITGSGTYLTILDASLPGYRELAKDLKGSLDTGLIPLIVIYPSDEDLDAPKALEVLGDESIVQPFEVKKLLNIADAELVRASEEELIFRQQVMFHFPTNDDEMDKAIGLSENLFELSGLNEEESVSLTAAFREAVGNAAQHGNKYRDERKIEVLYLLDREKITLVVKDQGGGFDHAQYVRFGQAADALSAARERHQQGKMGGLGIMLMLKCCDRIEYNHSGNSITLTKRLEPAQVPASV